jgi:hypothetical protein
MKRWFTFIVLISVSLLSLAEDLKQIMAEMPDGRVEKITYFQKKHMAYIEEDILLPIQHKSRGIHAMIVPKIGGGRWPMGIIPFSISEDLPLANKIAVLQAIEHWQERTNVEFVELTSKNRQEFPDYVFFAKASGTTCASFVGRMGGGQIVSLSPRCNKMITVHEIGHVLGLWHEQSRIDRDQYVQILWENIDAPHEYNFNQHFTDGRDFGEYDYQSIMHYAPFAFSKNGLPTIIPLQPGVEIGQRREISPADIAAVNAMYPHV